MQRGNNTQRNDTYFGCLIGASTAMRKVFAHIEKISNNTLPVFITGATGTGKEKTAEAIHKYSSFSNGPFIPFHCAGHNSEMLDSALFGHTKGAFTGATQSRNGAIKQAQGGTLFLDEICDMPRELQLKILRFTQDGKYQPIGSDNIYTSNTRLICATRRDPHLYVQEKKFRKDLFYRLYVQPVTLPSLSDRANDITDLTLFFIKQNKKSGVTFSPASLKVLNTYSWPGNIRELKNLVETITSQYHCQIIEPHYLPSHIQGSNKPHGRAQKFTSPTLPLRYIERNVIENTINHCHGNIIQAAAILEISPSTIYRKQSQWQNWQ